jgi:NAD+ kinase
MKRVGIIAKANSPMAKTAIEKLRSWLGERKIEMVMDPVSAAAVGERSEWSPEEIANSVELMIVLGGDGTLLGVSRIIRNGTPILGVNLGSLGFLTEVTFEDLFPVLEKILEGRQVTDERGMLEVRFLPREGKMSEHVVLNDAVISRGSSSGMVEIEVKIDGDYVTTYRGDGLIVSTPTGSTAYNLAAGGPIVHPTTRALIVNPICPHTLTNRPLVIPDSSTVEVTLLSCEPGAILSMDGQIALPVSMGDRIAVVRSKRNTKLLQAQNRNYFEVLRQKLKWGDTTGLK